MESSSLTRSYLSPAKVNLSLKVLARREDGYHEIVTLMQPVSVCDRLTVTVAGGKGVIVTTDSDEAPGGPENLAHRAAALFLERVKASRRVEIHIEKSIPVGAGLGGGSSDAATTMMALNELLGAGLGQGELMGLGAAVGSDVPFFFLRGPAVGRGRGEALEAAKLPPLYYVLVNPGFHVSTAWAYSSLSLTKKHEDNNLLYSYEVFADGGRLDSALVNDLEAVTIARHPEISLLKQRLLEAGALGALMSGSGPTVFGVFLSGQDALSAYERLRPGVSAPARIFLAEGL